jgi:hypothetical protein
MKNQQDQELCEMNSSIKAEPRAKAATLTWTTGPRCDSTHTVCETGPDAYDCPTYWTCAEGWSDEEIDAEFRRTYDADCETLLIASFNGAALSRARRG